MSRSIYLIRIEERTTTTYTTLKDAFTTQIINPVDLTPSDQIIFAKKNNSTILAELGKLFERTKALYEPSMLGFGSNYFESPAQINLNSFGEKVVAMLREAQSDSLGINKVTKALHAALSEFANAYKNSAEAKEARRKDLDVAVGAWEVVETVEAVSETPPSATAQPQQEQNEENDLHHEEHVNFAVTPRAPQNSPVDLEALVLYLLQTEEMKREHVQSEEQKAFSGMGTIREIEHENLAIQIIELAKQGNLTEATALMKTLACVAILTKPTTVTVPGMLNVRKINGKEISRSPATKVIFVDTAEKQFFDQATEELRLAFVLIKQKIETVLDAALKTLPKIDRNDVDAENQDKAAAINITMVLETLKNNVSQDGFATAKQDLNDIENQNGSPKSDGTSFLGNLSLGNKLAKAREHIGTAKAAVEKAEAIFTGVKIESPVAQAPAAQANP